MEKKKQSSECTCTYVCTYLQGTCYLRCWKRAAVLLSGFWAAFLQLKCLFKGRFTRQNGRSLCGKCGWSQRWVLTRSKSGEQIKQLAYSTFKISGILLFWSQSSSFSFFFYVYNQSQRVHVFTELTWHVGWTISFLLYIFFIPKTYNKRIIFHPNEKPKLTKVPVRGGCVWSSGTRSRAHRHPNWKRNYLGIRPHPYTIRLCFFFFSFSQAYPPPFDSKPPNHCPPYCLGARC